MRTLHPFSWVVLGLLLFGCGKGRGDAESAQSAAMHQYVSPTDGFTIMVPRDPDVLGRQFAKYRFYSADMKELLLELSVSAIPLIYDQLPPGRNLDQLEQAYKGEPGAVVAVTPITLQGATGREFDITAGRRAPIRVRIFLAHQRMYSLDFNPNIPHAIEIADLFLFQFSM